MWITPMLAVLQTQEHLDRLLEGPTTFAIVFMLTSMGAVTALVVWCFYRILQGGLRFESQKAEPLDPATGDDPEAGRR